MNFKIKKNHFIVFIGKFYRLKKTFELRLKKSTTTKKINKKT